MGRAMSLRFATHPGCTSRLLGLRSLKLLSHCGQWAEGTSGLPLGLGFPSLWGVFPSIQLG